MIKNLLPLMIVLPMGAGFIIALLPEKFAYWANRLAIAVTALLLFGSGLFSTTGGYYEIGGWPMPVGINLSLDGFNRVLLLMVGIIGFTVAIYALNYMQLYTGSNRFFALLMLMLAGLNGTLLSGDLFNRFVYVEIAVISSYILVGFGCQAPELKAAFKYAVLGTVASTFTLLGIAVIYSLYGTVNIAHLSVQLAAEPTGILFNSPLLFAGLFMVLGFAYKAALVPFHVWQPDVFETAPAAVVGLISGGLVGVVGIYAMIRTIFTVFGITTWLGWMLLSLAVFSILYGSFKVLEQESLRRVYAYQTISQLGFSVLGFGVGSLIISQDGPYWVAVLIVAGAIFHLFNHAIFKTLLILLEGTVEHSEGYTDAVNLSDKTNCDRNFSIASFVAMASAAGIPPFAGFFSKMIILGSCVLAGYYLFAVVGVVGFIVSSVVYYRRRRRFFPGVEKIGGSMRFAVGFLTTVCLASTLLVIPSVWQLFPEQAAEDILTDQIYLEQIEEWRQKLLNMQLPSSVPDNSEVTPDD